MWPIVKYFDIDFTLWFNLDRFNPYKVSYQQALLWVGVPLMVTIKALLGFNNGNNLNCVSGVIPRWKMLPNILGDPIIFPHHPKHQWRDNYKGEYAHGDVQQQAHAPVVRTQQQSSFAWATINKR